MVNYIDNLEKINRVIEEIERESFGLHYSRPAQMLTDTQPIRAEGIPDVVACECTPDDGTPQRDDGIHVPVTNRNMEGRQTLEARKTGEAGETSAGTRYFAGIDGGTTCKIYGGALPPSKIILLDNALSAYKEEKKPQEIFISGVPCHLVAPRAVGDDQGVNYSWKINTAGMEISIHRNPLPYRHRVPLASVQMGAKALDQSPPANLVNAVVGLLGSLGAEVEGYIISRIDVNVTFTRKVSDIVKDVVDGRFVCVQRKRVPYVDDVFESVMLGKNNSPIQLRIYDKWREMMAKGDKYKMDRVMSLLHDGEMLGDAGRVEFSLKRDLLKRFSIDTFDDFDAHSSALVQYLTFNWFRHTDAIPDYQNGNSSRCKSSAFWKDVQEMFLTSFDGPLPLLRVEEKKAVLLSPDERARFSACYEAYKAKLIADDVLQRGITFEEAMRNLDSLTEYRTLERAKTIVEELQFGVSAVSLPPF